MESEALAVPNTPNRKDGGADLVGAGLEPCSGRCERSSTSRM